MPKGVPLTEEAASQRRREILDAAAHLFVDKGFQNTSMREIADAAGAGKSTLYDYFPTKDQILLFALEDAMEQVNQRAQIIAGLADPPRERIRQIMAMNLALLQADEGLLLRLSAQGQFLKAELVGQLAAKRRVYQDVIRGLIDEGIARGHFRKVDALVAARMLINAVPAAFFTTRPTGTAAEMLAEIVEIFLRGIAK
jgi:AcrR family transcriptional regulator